jgi:hypothetical protein
MTESLRENLIGKEDYVQKVIFYFIKNNIEAKTKNIP